MALGTAGVTIGLLLCWAATTSGQPARTPVIPTASLETVRVKGFVSPSRVDVHTPVAVDVILQNVGPAPVSPVTVDLPQFTLQEADKRNLSGLVLPARGRLLRRVTITPDQAGPFDVQVQLMTPGDAVREPIARLEVIQPPSFLATYGPVGIPLAVAVLTAVVTIGVQLGVWRAARRQKASESIVEIVTAQGRDYYFTMSGALKNLVKTLEVLSASNPGAEQDHLLRRAFFFFGIFAYKENEFAFNHGFLFLGNLWGELAVRRIVDRIANLVPLARSDEAIIHKCFSDMWRVHRGSAGPDAAQLFSVRTLYDLERVLTKPLWGCSISDEALRRAYDAVTPHLLKRETLEHLRALGKALAGILEYEFTKLFQDWYAGAKGQRQMPKKPPRDFNDIVGGSPRWEEVLAAVETS